MAEEGRRHLFDFDIMRRHRQRRRSIRPLTCCCCLLAARRAVAFSPTSPLNCMQRSHAVRPRANNCNSAHSDGPSLRRKVVSHAVDDDDDGGAVRDEDVRKRGIISLPFMSPSQRAERVENLRRLRRTALAARDREIASREDEARDRQDYFFLLEALVPSVLAFIFWDDVSRALSVYLDAHGVLGAPGSDQFVNDVLRPTITGVIVPVLGIALATLTSTTVNVLRERQVELRSLVNKEACDLRLLRRAVFGMFGTRQHAERRARALTLLMGYVDQLDEELSPGAIETLENLELSGGVAINEIDRLSAMMHGVDGAAVSRQNSVAVADDILARLNGYRSDRVALLLTDFPDLHWIVLISLSVSIIVAFLLESNQLVDQYLDSIQLRSLFGLLVGVFSAVATLCLDLDDPFTGSFSVTSASVQIRDLQTCLQEDVREANAEAGEVSTTALTTFRTFFGGPTEGGAASNSIRRKIQSRNMNAGKKGPVSSNMDVSPGDELFETGEGGSSRYGVLSTIYWHLLTSPMGSTVRAIGDVLAWSIKPVVRSARSLLSRVISRSRRVWGVKSS